MSSSYDEDVFASSGRFINHGATAVMDSILGLIASNPQVGLLDYGKVVIRRDYMVHDIVKVISGGASGHEPAHAGYVGKGMLSAAIQGDVFNSPGQNDILRTIREVTYKHQAGVLVIIQNNTADRLNFGLAVERARNLGINVKLLVVAEDCSMIDDIQGKRGLAGIILLNKIAGAMAESGCPLDEIYSFCEKVHDNLSSILLSLHACTSPTIKTCICTKQFEDNEMEIGAGLQGELGLKRMEKANAANTCRMLFEEIGEYLGLDNSTHVVVLINNLGNTLKMEELIFAKEFIGCFQEQQIPITRVYRGHFLTALDMRGFSVTVLKVIDPKIVQYLDAACETVSWGMLKPCGIPADLLQPIRSRVADHRKRAVPPGLRLGEEQANIILLAIQFACDALISCEKQLNIIDSESGNGNTGTKMKNGAETILAEAKKKTLTFQHPKVLFESLSLIAEKRIGGTLGSLYSILFEAAANSLRKLPENHLVSVYTWYKCLNEACDVFKSCCKVEYGYGTMYDPLYACCESMADSLESGYDGLESFGSGVSAAEDTAQQTRHPSKRYPDSGAHVVGIWMRAVFEGIKMRCGND